MNEVGAIVDGLQRNARGKTGGDLLDLGLEIVDDVERVLPTARDRDARDDLAFPIQLPESRMLRVLTSTWWCE